MAITDNLLIRLQARAGQAAPTSDVGAGETLTGGTISLIDVGSEKAWRFTGGQATVGLTTGHSIIGANNGTGATVAFRGRFSTPPSGDFDAFYGVSTNTTSSNGIYTGKNGSGNWRIRFTTSYSISAGSHPGASTVFTLVTRVTTLAAGASDYVKAWRDTVGRVGNTADFTTSGENITGTTVLDTWNIDAASSTVIDVLDFMFWGRELTDQECADVADGIRTQLPLPGGGGGTSRANLIKQVSRYHLGVGSLGRIQRRS